MKLSCFIVPIHPPHFAFACNLLASRDRFLPDLDIFFVFSSLEDCEKFKALKASIHKVIICNEEVRSLNKKTGIVTFKKFFGLDYVFACSSYRYAGVVDAECEFTKAVDVDRLFQEFCEAKTLYSSACRARWQIRSNKACAKVFPRNIYLRLKMITNQFSQNFWFNQIPIYEKGSYLDFRELVRLSYPIGRGPASFEYALYSYYLFTRRGWSLVSVDSSIDPLIYSKACGLLESACDREQACYIAKILHSFWAREALSDPKIFIKWGLESLRIKKESV
jgi:hypothetical protein